MQRWITYQKERFPLLAHFPLVLLTSWCVLSFASSAAVRLTGMLAVTCLILGLFFQLRVFDEYKDFEEDKAHRPYRPVPRGLITLRELRNAALFIAGFQFTTTYVWNYPSLTLLLVCWIYMILMGKEFFNPEWLKKQPLLYMLSHLPIVGLIQLYAASFVWDLNFPQKAWVLFVVSLSGGALLEFGRKIRPAEKEEPGVQTYSAIWGIEKALLTWFLAGSVGVFALGYFHGGWLVLSIFYLLMFPFAVVAAVRKTAALLKHVELLSALWIVLMYLALARFP
ncbi:UbiA family prenyltransferase [Deinococcus roseus]|uniref:Prenyltransferase n=1 Tax=Deinococcus roseus TaxID=392414 RepID=A0ABQ2D3Q3_9DEIO|nr:UbiA family prenyltransferase [Deinococcus roseus]GGJ41823.1 hypothetical protein GCM10008938_29860 [Deinococcus roseus]